jgi:hypothetical protein
MTSWRTLRELNSENPCKDYGQALEVFEANYGATEDLACWRTESVVIDEVDRYQLIDDPDDENGREKVNDLRHALCNKRQLPPLVLVHYSRDERGSYALMDGRHRFNAAHEEGVNRLAAWVAHIGCCCGEAAL